MPNSKIEKGSLIWVGNCFYVVVKDTGAYIHCICDHANNIFSWIKDDIELLLSPKTAVMLTLDSHPSNQLADEELEFYEERCLQRGIPIDVIAEVLTGCHDERFS